jgi:hypothetical protein
MKVYCYNLHWGVCFNFYFLGREVLTQKTLLTIVGEATSRSLVTIPPSKMATYTRF